MTRVLSEYFCHDSSGFVDEHDISDCAQPIAIRHRAHRKCRFKMDGLRMSKKQNAKAILKIIDHMSNKYDEPWTYGKFTKMCDYISELPQGEKTYADIVANLICSGNVSALTNLKSSVEAET